MNPDTAAECPSVIRTLADSLERLAEKDPEVLKNIVGIHNCSFLELALENARILELTAHYLQFETSLGQRSFVDMCENDTTTWFIEDENDYKEAKPFAASLKISVVNAGSRTVSRLLPHIAHTWPRGNFSATTFSKLQTTVTRELEFSAALRRLLHQTLQALRHVRAKAAPANPLRQTAPTITAPIDASRAHSRKGLMPDFLKEFDPTEQVEDLELPLRLNTSEPLIQLLSDPKVQESRVHSVLVAFYHHALTTARQMPSTLDDETYYHSIQTFLLGGPDDPA